MRVSCRDSGFDLGILFSLYLLNQVVEACLPELLEFLPTTHVSDHHYRSLFMCNSQSDIVLCQ